MDSKLPIGLLTNSDIHPTIEGAIDEVKFFQLGFIICKRNEQIRLTGENPEFLVS